MSTSKRPGGLTALAVINFVFAGFGLLSMVAMVALLQFADAAMATADAGDRAAIEAFQNLGMGVWALIVATEALSSALLVIAGVGYLKMSRWGRSAGNLYAVLTIASALLTAFLMPAALGGGFQLTSIIGLVYPILTLILLNTTFKDEFRTAE
jgi:magnesium-transporting ATPase (P-type)